MLLKITEIASTIIDCTVNFDQRIEFHVGFLITHVDKRRPMSWVQI